jgi:hypothetical protein
VSEAYSGARETGGGDPPSDPILLDIAGVRRVVAEARATFEPILPTIEPRARRQQAPDHRLPRLIHLLERVTEIKSQDQMDRVFRWCLSLQRTTLAFVRWRNDPEGPKLIEEARTRPTSVTTRRY